MLTRGSYGAVAPGGPGGARAAATVLCLAAAAAAGVVGGVAAGPHAEAAREAERSASSAAADGRVWPPAPYPPGRAVDRARAFAAAAPGSVAFAVADPVRGVRGLDEEAHYSSASVSKALLLAAELRRLARDGQALDSASRSLLEPMIVYSDNDAAAGVYARVGDAGLADAAHAGGMRDLEVTPGYWGGAQVTAADLARFFLGLERVLPARERRYGMRLLANVTATQRWGIPAAAPGGWTVHFKGGWRPVETEETSGPVTHQAALLVHRSGRRIAIAVLTDQSPGTTSFGTIEGITRRLLADDPRPPSWPAP